MQKLGEHFNLSDDRGVRVVPEAGIPVVPAEG